ncbi:tyrosine-type recombinase/integrase [Crossiella sp. CA198]|uniref:tyrosine-type recombinase/integrase n=1 Tax=Crossiella sp. CA198 TaxID=3455607 RepID=UPI003F8D2E6E
MNPTYKVNVWALKEIKPRPGQKRRPKPWGVRWITAGEEHSEWYKTFKLADRRRSQLIAAAENGEPFDTRTGLPQSEYRKLTARSLLKLAQEYIDHEWDTAAPNTRKRHVDTLAVPVAAFVRPDKHAPDPRTVRRVLTTLLLPKNQRERPRTAEEDQVAEWLVKHSRPVKELDDKAELGKVLTALGRNLNGRPAAAWTTRTRRGVFHHVMQHGVDLKELASNPVTGSKIALTRGNAEVDPRVVVNPRQAAQLLAAVTYVGRYGQNQYLYAFFAAMYFGGFRPSEVNRIREQDLSLPDQVWNADADQWEESGQWGTVTLEKSASRSNARYTDSGELWEARDLKRRAEGDTRSVPIPPQLVRAFRDHLAEFGTTPDGRLFRGKESGGPINATVYTHTWKRARKIALTPEQTASPLAGDPYDLRHAAVSTWLVAGVPVAEVAQRAGHSVEVLMKTYWKVIDGNKDASNTRIGSFLGPAF